MDTKNLAATLLLCATDFKDLTLKCADCGDPFEFPTFEQALFRKRNLHEPKRCPPCRIRKKLRYTQHS
jgi:hypothetical protein